MRASEAAPLPAIAQVLCGARTALGLSQEVWADLLGVRAKTIGRWETGQTKVWPQTRMHVRAALRFGPLRARLHAQPAVELALLGAGLLDPLDRSLEPMSDHLLMLATWDGLSPFNRAVLVGVLKRALAELERHSTPGQAA